MSNLTVPVKLASYRGLSLSSRQNPIKLSLLRPQLLHARKYEVNFIQ
jgi:hypothetical protein